MNVRLYHAVLPEYTPQGRAAAEREAVLLLVREAFGDEAEYIHDASGAPAVLLCGNKTNEISVSHCKGLAVLAVAPLGVRVGVDAETPREQLYRVKNRFLSHVEQEWFTTLEELTRAWTIKEAVFKASGESGVDFVRELDLLPRPTLRGRGYTVVIQTLIEDAIVTVVVGDDTK